MPMDRSRYPKNWDEIAFKIKSEVSWRCEGCDRPCRIPKESDSELIERICALPNWVEDLADEDKLKLARFTLTVAHLDHIPENCARTNLKALCSVCHCRMDLKAMGQKKMLKREWNGQMKLF